jgi:hypothetical protein
VAAARTMHMSVLFMGFVVAHLIDSCDHDV